MGRRMNVPESESYVKREYCSFRGVDFALPASMVNPSRSPDALNVYKDYSSTAGQAIETRPGFVKLGEMADKVYGIHNFGNKTLVHAGKNLFIWIIGSSLSLSLSNENTLSRSMNEHSSVSFNFEDKLYILDGANYYVYDGNNLENVIGYVPTTRINSDASGANGEDYQGVNFLSNYRINTFCADGVSTTFYLDGFPEETPVVKVNGVDVSVSSFSSSDGSVTLTSPPVLPLTDGEANVEIKYKQTISGNAEKIKKCTLAKVFDGRVFLSGNEDKKGYLYHSELEDPTYFRDDSYYNDGDDNIPIASLTIAGNKLIVIKDDGNEESPKVFYHTPSLDADLGKVYPTTTTQITLGTTLKGINFNDTICYLTKRGLDSIYMRGNYQANLYHKSSLIDRELANETNISDMKIWNNYLCILSGDRLYLADSRQIHNDYGTYEYEWYLWNGLKCSLASGKEQEARSLYVWEDNLYFVTDNCICCFEGTNDNGKAINSYWTTPEDVFNYPAYLKTVNKRGAYALFKQIPNSKVKIACITDKEKESLLYEATASGFNFNEFTFTNLNFSGDINSSRFFKIKKKRIQFFSLRFYSDEIDSPFGIYKAAIEYSVKKYVKGE